MCLWAVFRRFDLAEVWALVLSGGLPALAAFFIYPLVCLWDVGSWKLLFPPPHASRVRFYELFWIRLAGEAVNNVTPVLDIGGEPLKVHLSVRRFGVPLSSAAASVVVAKTALLVAEVVFMLLGVGLSFALLPLPVPQRVQLSAALVLVCLAFIGFLVIQQGGAFRRLNPEIGVFYARHPRRFAAAAALNGIGWVAGGVETWVFCRILGLEIPLVGCVMLEALIQLVRNGSFFIPMNLGVQEGGFAFFFHAMGLDPVTGVALSLLKRARQLLWTAAGFLVWGTYQYQEAKQRKVFAREELLSLDTQLDRRIHRPAANILAFLLSKLPVTPNQVTVCNLVPAVLSGAFFAVGRAETSFLALFFFYLWSVLDHADGALARLKGMTSDWGRLLDDVFDVLGSGVILLGAYWGLARVWNAQDRALLDRLFFSGLVLNSVSGFLIFYVKRWDRLKAVQRKVVSEGLTGRDAFYVLWICVVSAQVWGPKLWLLYPLTMIIFIFGLYVVSTAALWETANFFPSKKWVVLAPTVVFAVCLLWPSPYKGNTVLVSGEYPSYELVVNGKPFYIQGAGVGEAFGKKGENYLALARELGANAVRTWGTDQGTKKYLDEAHRLGMYVDAGIWIDHVDAKKTVSYLRDDTYKRKKEKEALGYVRRFKGHPSILAWNVGNECIFFTKDPAEREALCRFLEELVRKVKQEDPYHPVIYTSVNSLDLPHLKKYVPSLDIIGMNVYGSVIGTQSGWQALDFGKPYVITEFGPLGPWDLPKDVHGKMLEQDDLSKSQQYRNHWALIRERRGKNVGAFVFHIGETSQESLTMWNLNDHLYKKEPFVVIQKLFGAGDLPAGQAGGSDHAPRIRAFAAPDTAAPGSVFEVELEAADPEGAPLTYEFKASTSMQDILQYYVNTPVPVEVQGSGPKAVIKAPATKGIYRLYGFARDKTGRSASLSRTLRVE